MPLLVLYIYPSSHTTLLSEASIYTRRRLASCTIALVGRTTRTLDTKQSQNTNPKTTESACIQPMTVPNFRKTFGRPASLLPRRLVSRRPLLSLLSSPGPPSCNFHLLLPLPLHRQCLRQSSCSRVYTRKLVLLLASPFCHVLCCALPLASFCSAVLCCVAMPRRKRMTTVAVIA